MLSCERQPCRRWSSDLRRGRLRKKRRHSTPYGRHDNESIQSDLLHNVRVFHCHLVHPSPECGGICTQCHRCVSVVALCSKKGLILNCRTCNTPHPPCELVDKSDTDKKGVCLQCLLKQRDELLEACRIYARSHEYGVIKPEDADKAIFAAMAKIEEKKA